MCNDLTMWTNLVHVPLAGWSWARYDLALAQPVFIVCCTALPVWRVDMPGSGAFYKIEA